MVCRTAFAGWARWAVCLALVVCLSTCIPATVSADDSGHASAVAADDSDAPWFCHDLDCPAFTVVKSVDDLELRSYAKASWASTNVTGMDYDKAVRVGFMRLFGFISGDNEAGQKIEMTAPVRVKLIPGQGPACDDIFTISFFLPFQYQEGGDVPPAPSRDNVFISTTPATQYWVRSYGGWTSGDKVVEQATGVLEHLDELGEAYDASSFFSAGYDPPFRIINRHNEVWIPAAAGQAQRVRVHKRGSSDVADSA